MRVLVLFVQVFCQVIGDAHFFYGMKLRFQVVHMSFLVLDHLFEQDAGTFVSCLEADLHCLVILALTRPRSFAAAALDSTFKTL
jgi:hypothetical protein